MSRDAILRRSADVRALLTEHVEGPFRDGFAGVVCDGCGLTVVADTPELLTLELDGWAIGDELGDPDYCPECAP